MCVLCSVAMLYMSNSKILPQDGFFFRPFLVSCYKWPKPIFDRGGTNSSMFVNCLVFGDVREVRSSVFCQNHMFGYVRSLVLMILKKIGPIFY